MWQADGLQMSSRRVTPASPPISWRQHAAPVDQRPSGQEAGGDLPSWMQHEDNTLDTFQDVDDLAQSALKEMSDTGPVPEPPPTAPLPALPPVLPRNAALHGNMRSLAAATVARFVQIGMPR